jgi:hypothetical protein
MKLVKKLTLVDYVNACLNSEGEKWDSLIEPLQLDATVVDMIAAGKTRLPITKVIPLAYALDVAAIDLLTVMLTDYSPETLDVLDKVTGGLFRSDEVLTIIDVKELLLIRNKTARRRASRNTSR